MLRHLYSSVIDHPAETALAVGAARVLIEGSCRQHRAAWQRQHGVNSAYDLNDAATQWVPPLEALFERAIPEAAMI